MLAALGRRRAGRAALHRRAVAAQSAGGLRRAACCATRWARAVVVVGDELPLRPRPGRRPGSACARLGRTLGFDVDGVAPGRRTRARRSAARRIREALARGRGGRRPRELLGRPFFVDGDGRARARAAGAPSASPPRTWQPVNETLPARGVYACWCRGCAGAGARRAAVVNVGRRPTFGAGDASPWRRTCSTSTATSTAGRCGWRSSSGCARSGPFAGPEALVRADPARTSARRPARTSWR